MKRLRAKLTLSTVTIINITISQEITGQDALIMIANSILLSINARIDTQR